MILAKLEKNFLPILLKIGENKRLIAIRNGITLTIPFTIIGSIFLILGNLPIEAWTNFIAPVSDLLNAPVTVTFGMLGLISAIGIGYNMGKEFDVDPISNTVVTTVAFLLATLADDFSINIDTLGATGMFTAIIVALFTTELFRFFVKHKITIKMPDGVPPSVAQSFSSLIPAAAILTSIWIIRVLLGIDLNEVIQFIFKPLVFGLSTLPGLMVYTLLVCFLWSCGIHGDNVLSGIASPIFLGYLAANTAAFQNGQPIPYEIADGFWILFMCLGGTGSTLGLVLAMLRSKSKMYKSLGKMAFPSALFCINEPVIFGFPVVMNPIMMIPFITAPVVLGSATYVLMKIGFVGKIVFQVPWTIPPIIGPYLATNGSFGAAIWSACSIVIAYLIYLPFFKMSERKQVLLEQGESEAEAVTDAIKAEQSLN
ncbi:PTS sugar transporter subunit IIC [Carnobacterium gallinarum]|uniref:PTS sugar transporter subunit IIC n=1 Tax=Carnobacterium gallinarum TaxID=2749 RepID=UPI000AA07F03|nr:PTS transporter subunit EIIC [Carnobacterium gallinarum]